VFINFLESKIAVSDLIKINNRPIANWQLAPTHFLRGRRGIGRAVLLITFCADRKGSALKPRKKKALASC